MLHNLPISKQSNSLGFERNCYAVNFVSCYKKKIHIIPNAKAICFIMWYNFLSFCLNNCIFSYLYSSTYNAADFNKCNYKYKEIEDRVAPLSSSNINLARLQENTNIHFNKSNMGGAPLLEVFKARLDVTLGSLV